MRTWPPQRPEGGHPPPDGGRGVPRTRDDGPLAPTHAESGFSMDRRAPTAVMAPPLATPDRGLGERVRRLRNARGLTQTELAEARVSKEYISQIETGKARPTSQTLEWLPGGARGRH